MPIRFKCQCGTPYTLADQLAGRTFKCTKCEATITLPSLGPPSPAAPQAYMPPSAKYITGDAPKWGSSGINPATTDSGPDLKIPSSDVVDAANYDLMDAPTMDPDRDQPGKPKKGKKKTTNQRPAETFELPDQIELMPEDAPTADPDRDDVLLAKAALEPVPDDADVFKSDEKKKKKKKKGAKGGASDRISAKKRSSAETSSYAMECPACSETIARSATECPSCGVPFTGKKRGLGAREKQILSGLAALAGGIVLLVGVVFVVKMLHDDTASGTGPVKKPLAKGRNPFVPESFVKLPPEATNRDEPGAKKVDPPKPDGQAKPVEPKPATPTEAPKVDPAKDEPGRPVPPPATEPFPDGPHKAAVLALRDAPDLAAVERAARELGAADGFADAAGAYMKAAEAPLRGRITRALLAQGSADAKKAALSVAWRSDDIEVLLPAIEVSAELEGQDGLLQRIDGLRGRSRDTAIVGEAYARCLVTPETAVPEGVAVSAAKAVAEKDKELGAHLAPVLLAGGEGEGLALAPDALAARSPLVRKAVLHGLETFLGRKGEKDPVADPEGARAEWTGIVGGYAPLRDKLAKACDEGLARGITAEQLAVIVDARLDLMAHRKEALAALPIFVKDSAAHSAAAGAALAELIPRFAQGVEKESAKTLNDVIDALGEDARVAAPGIIEGCLRACDHDCAAAAARALDKGIVGFQDAAAFPDLIDPAPPPRTTLDSQDPNAVIAAALFRGDGKAVEKLAFSCKKADAADEALARLGSHETEKRLLQACVGKEKLPQGVEPFATLTDCATKGYAQELKTLLTSGKDFDHIAYENLARTVDKSCAPSDALVLVKLAELGRDRGDAFCANYAYSAAKAAGSSDSHETRNAIYQAIKALDKQAKATVKPKGKDPAPPPAATGAVDVRALVARALPETNADPVHDDGVATFEKWLGELKVARTPPLVPADEDLNHFLRTVHGTSLTRDQALAKSLLDVSGAVLPGEQERFKTFAYRYLERVGGAGIEIARMEVTAANTALTARRGEAAVVLGRSKDAGSLDALKQVVDVLCDKKHFLPTDAGVPAGIALIDPKEGGTAAVRLLSQEKAPIEVREGCFFALAKSGDGEDLKALGEWARKPDPDVRAHVARGIACAVRSPGGAGGVGAVLERLRIDPSPLVRAEAAIAYMEEAHDSGSLLEGALALDPADKKLLDRARGGILAAAATGDSGDVSLFLDLCRAYDHAAKEHRLEARPVMSQGRIREIIRLARAGAHK